MPFHYPTAVKIFGNKNAAKKFIGFGKSQMAILENQMSFQNLKQASRRVTLPNGVIIFCSKNHNIKHLEVFIPPVDQYKETQIIEIEVNYLSIIYGNAEETLTFNYVEDSDLLFPEDGDAVFCSDGGDGVYNYISEGKLYGQFTMCFPPYDSYGIAIGGDTIIEAESNGAVGVVIDCAEKVYKRTCTVDELYPRQIGKTHPEGKIDSAYDVFPLTNVYCKGDPVVEGAWSKTYDDLIVTVYSYLPGLYVGELLQWFATASYKNDLLYWIGGDSQKFPSGITGFSRQVAIGVQGTYTRKTHIGFDIWRNGSGNDSDYYVGLIGEQEATLHQFKLNIADLVLEREWSVNLDKTEPGSSIWSPEDAETHEVSSTKRLLHLVGYGFDEGSQVHKIYWSMLYGDTKYGEDIVSMTGNESPTKYVSKDDEQDHHMQIRTVMWNPLTKKPFFVWETALEYELGNYSSSGISIFDNNWIHASISYPCPDCTNEETVIQYTWDGVIVDIPMYTIIPPNDYYSYEAVSHVAINAGTEYLRGFYSFDENSFDKGNRVDAQGGVIQTSSFWNPNTGTTNQTDGFVVSPEYECIPLSMYDYTFTRGIFTPDGFVFRYKKEEYSTYVNQDGKTICYIPEDGVSYHDVGNANIFPAMTVFPYDDTWKSILLHGYGRSNSNSGKAETEIKNYVIYSDRDTSSLFLIDDYGSQHEIGNDGDYDRAFFKQQSIISEIEIEQ